VKRLVVLGACVVLLASPAAAAAPHPRLFVFPTADRLYLTLNVANPMLASPQLRQAIALALDHRSLAAASAWGRLAARPLAPKDVSAEAIQRARVLAAPWQGSTLVIRWGRGTPPWFGLLSYQLAQIGLTVRLQGLREPNADIALWGFIPNFPHQSPSMQLRDAFSGAYWATPIAAYADRIFVSARVKRLIRSPVYGVDLAATTLR